MNSDVKTIIIGAISGTVVELIKYLAKKYSNKRKSTVPNQKQNLNISRKKQTVFDLSSNKKQVTRAFYLSFFMVLILILSALYINSAFEVNSRGFVFVTSAFSSIFLFNHFMSFHESLAHWDEKTEDVASDAKANSKK